MPLEHLSYSNISLFMRDPLGWKKRYIMHDKYEINDNMRFGKAFDKAIELQLTDDKTTPKNNWKIAVDHEFPEESEDDLPHELYLQGRDMFCLEEVQQSIDNIALAKINDELALQFPVTLHVPNIPLPFIGYVDAIEQTDNGLLPIDFKTTSKRWGDSKVKNLTSKEPLDKISGWDVGNVIQQDIYLAALNQMKLISFPAKFKYLVFVKKKNPEVQEFVIERDFEDIYRTFETLYEVWGIMEKVIGDEHS